MIENIWSGKSKLYWLLLPLSWLYGAITLFRRLCYRWGIFKAWQSPVPVVVVGNLTAGGNGKTPLVVWLVEQLTAKGVKVGVISRGYGGKAKRYPLLLQTDTSAEQAGDEPVLIYQRTHVPVAVAPNRQQAIIAVLSAQPVDVIISDDGLQHYALQRDVELVVVDGVRRFGNGWWLPAGPMRERAKRLKSVDAVIVNGGTAQANELPMWLVAEYAINVKTGEKRAVTELKHIVAMAGIGFPPRFFKTLTDLGIVPEQTHAFPDHQRYHYQQLAALVTEQQTLLMTEKDAVKCSAFATENWWYLPINAVFPEQAGSQVLAKIEQVLQHRP